jgi:pyrroloquinoline quinone (PQQ) biosynthesis protein C
MPNSMNTNSNSLSWLVQELRPIVRQICEHSAINAISDQRVSIAQVGQFAEQYSYYCDAFPRMLALAAGNVPDDATRMNLVKNLWEEHGSGDLTRSHRALFSRFRAALPLSNFGPLKRTEAFISEGLLICRGASHLESLAYLGPGAEMFTSTQYERLLSGLEKFDIFNSTDLDFWRVHIECDDHHFEEMAEALNGLIRTDADKILVLNSSVRAAKTELAFWDGVFEECFGG